MKTVIIRPVEIYGHCPAGLTLDDEFRIEGMRLEDPRGSRICFLALSQFAIGMGIWQLQAGERFFSHVSCPGCTSQLAQENRVVFLLGHADLWRLSQLISAYLRLARGRAETETALRLKEEAIAHQSRGEYAEATRKMEAALEEMERPDPPGVCS